MIRLAFPLVLFAALSGCQLVGPSNEIASGGEAAADTVRLDLEEARARWAAAGIDSYRYTLHRGCFCGTEWRGPFRITVRDGRIAEATREGEPVDAAALQLPTVPDLFDLLADAADREADRIDATYEAGTGAPVEIYIDYSFGIADEEAAFTVSDLTSIR